MPKVKTNRSASKRFKTSKTGKIMRHKAYGRHLKACKSAKRRRNLRKGTVLTATDTARVKAMLPHS